MKNGWDMAILEACQGGAKWICVREKDTTPRDLMDLLARAKKIAEKFGAQVFLNGRADIARATHADGLHLPENEISVEAARMTLGFHTPIGVSVHDLQGAKRAETEGANYLLFGSIYETPSHPDGKVAGLEELSQITRSVKIPVYAVGGLNSTNAPACIEAGAKGIAIISAAWERETTNSIREIRKSIGEIDAPLHGLAAILKNGHG
jgi:thiamine-phosphate pyrophosphorylase